MTLLDVHNLSVTIRRPDTVVQAVDNFGFALESGEILGIVGESGSGKTQAMLALLGLTSEETTVQGEAFFRGEELLSAEREVLNRVRGEDIAMIFQDPMDSLNPYIKVSTQLIEALCHHKKLGRMEARRRAIEMLARVMIPEPDRRIDQYPHQFSGGMRQRLMIAMALLREPKILIADEPTTSLDVIVQAEILALLKALQIDTGISIVFITHDLSVVANLCDRVIVMYAGRKVEQAAIHDLFESPLHPYTMGLLRASRSINTLDEPLYSIDGTPPRISEPENCCYFHPRCPKRLDVCSEQAPALTDLNGHLVGCWLQNNDR